MRYLIRFSYDGTNFYGYEKQPNKRSVEEELEKAVNFINNKKETKVTASGRTDKGVHALDQTASFTLDVDITLYKLKSALNSLLPEDIHVNKVEIVNEDFHSRYMVKKKTYKYIINMGEYNPLERNYVLELNRKLDVEKMKIAIKDFIGKHNFENFTSPEAKKDNYEREILDASITCEGEKLIIRFSGTGFMKYQVRNMVGTLIKIGSNKLDENIIQKILIDNNYRKFVYTAKAHGLYLEKVQY
jgi:tRNA pseudouridine38-40 synthase